ncbi:hypothetical protein ACF06X_01135 [Streptomyces sp. NPDC015346]|uniref:hypothetical protein n=1 Tax=Streptomyces sp. NPDC015346 TaxID=3364954 RepID=UPI0036F50FE6
MLHRIARMIDPLLRLLRRAWPPPSGRHARRQDEARSRRRRRRALWLAVHGIDIGPRVIHGREVAA